MQIYKMPQAETVLREVIFLLSGVFFVAWLIYPVAFRQRLLLGAYFSLANLLNGLGIWLVSRRSEVPSFLNYQVADWLVIGGFIAFWAGIHSILIARRRPLGVVIAPLFLEIAVTVFLEPNPNSYAVRALLFNTVCCGIALYSGLDIYRGMRDLKMRVVACLCVGGPFFVAAFVFAVRFIQVSATLVQSSMPLRDATNGFSTFLWMFFSIVTLINLSIITMVVGRLISELEASAELDPLTNALNRRFVNESFRCGAGAFARSAQPYSCVIIDLDNFKKINDQYGHDVGDKALVHACNIFRSCLRASDQLGRYGGEEFIVMCADTDHSKVVDVAERLRLALSGTPIQVHGNSITLTASLGVATLERDDSLETFLKRADVAMYQAKQSGRNCVGGK